MLYTKTTLTVPEHLLQQAKLYAINEKKTISELLREALTERLTHASQQRREPTHRLGVIRVGIAKAYKKRSDLYANHIQRKMGI